MDIERLTRVGKKFAARMGSHTPIGVFASSAAFFFFTALIPLIMLICAILPMTSLTANDVTDLIMAYVPAAMEQVVRNAVDAAWEASNGGVIVVSTIFALWLASVAMLAVIRGLDAVYHVKKRTHYFALRGIASLYTILAMVVVVALMFVMMYGKAIGNIIVGFLPHAEARVRVLLSLRYIVSALLLVVIFQTCYAFAPSERQPFKQQLPGAVFSSLVWTVTSAVFSLLTTESGVYSMYGSLAMFVITLMYAYLMVYIMFLGAEVNAFLMENDVVAM